MLEETPPTSYISTLIEGWFEKKNRNLKLGSSQNGAIATNNKQ
jgi:hypothetical protein